MAWLLSLSFVAGCLATPIHRAVEAHDGHHESEEGGPHDSDHPSHPSSDHEVLAIRADVQAVSFTFEAGTIEFSLPAPAVRTWVRTVEAEANGPPDSPESPPRPARAPPL